jgi:signal transduction histidine kinase
VEMLIDGEAGDQETTTKFCEIIQNQAKRLNFLIEDILNVSKIESGLMRVLKRPVNIAGIIEEQVQMVKSYAQEKTINVNITDRINSVCLYADRDMLGQVMNNLLSNAVKYTKHDGKIDIRAEIDENLQNLIVKVADNGCGISGEDKKHLFQKFYRAEASKKYAEGSGLGLSLVKQIIENLHGGKVFLHSVPGKGSTFGFEIPLAGYEKMAAV